MDIGKLWEKAQGKTEVVRGRVKSLATFQSTRVPYIFLAESAVNEGNTVVRKGKIVVEKPLIFLPENMPQFEGFDFEEALDIDEESVKIFFLMRGIRFPSLKYNNAVDLLDLDEDSLGRAVEKYRKNLERQENVNTVLIVGPEDCWQFSLLLYVSSLVGRCARNDITNLFDKYQKGMQ